MPDATFVSNQRDLAGLRCRCRRWCLAGRMCHVHGVSTM